MRRDIVISMACLVWSVVPGVGANVSSRYPGATPATEPSCTILERAELAEEQNWSNFKRKAAQHQGKRGNEYTDALHDVWNIMHRLQHP